MELLLFLSVGGALLSVTAYVFGFMMGKRCELESIETEVKV